jgi:hypothetical protein
MLSGVSMSGSALSISRSRNIGKNIDLALAKQARA